MTKNKSDNNIYLSNKQQNQMESLNSLQYDMNEEKVASA